MLEREWKKESFQKPEKIWPLWRRIMKRLALTALERRMKREKNIKRLSIATLPKFNFKHSEMFMKPVFCSVKSQMAYEIAQRFKVLLLNKVN
uniref:Transmembrane protein, putative n=1 Tax=Nothobranchius kadleci TaxID=1051664 RepID=A0A1A8D698_NOTKA